MNYKEFEKEFKNIEFKDKRVLIVSDNFDNTMNKLNKIGNENNVKFTYGQFGSNTKEDSIYVTINKNINTDIRIMHINMYASKNIRGINYDHVIFDTDKNIQYDKCFKKKSNDGISVCDVPICNRGFLKINDIEIPELSKFEVYLIKNNDEDSTNKFIGMVEVDIHFINYYIDNLILDNTTINMYAKYDNNMGIIINNCKPIIKDKSVKLFELKADKEEFVGKSYKFKFDLKDLKLEE